MPSNVILDNGFAFQVALEVNDNLKSQYERIQDLRTNMSAFADACAKIEFLKFMIECLVAGSDNQRKLVTKNWADLDAVLEEIRASLLQGQQRSSAAVDPAASV